MKICKDFFNNTAAYTPAIRTKINPNTTPRSNTAQLLANQRQPTATAPFTSGESTPNSVRSKSNTFTGLTKQPNPTNTNSSPAARNAASALLFG